MLNANGQLNTVWAGPTINGPWGNMATVDNGSTATLFISMAGFDVPGPDVHDATGSSVIVNKATVLRLQLSIPRDSRRRSPTRPWSRMVSASERIRMCF